MNGKLFLDLIEGKKQDFRAVSGSDYQDSAYSVPESTPQALIKLVATTKVLVAESRQIEIMREVRSFAKSGDAFVIPRDKSSLTDEFDQLTKKIELWSPHQ